MPKNTQVLTIINSKSFGHNFTSEMPGCTHPPLVLKSCFITFLPFYKSPVGQTDAVLPQDVGHRQWDAHMSGNIT